MEGIIITSFFLKPIELNARCKADVPLLQVKANLEPVFLDIRDSNFLPKDRW